MQPTHTHAAHAACVCVCVHVCVCVYGRVCSHTCEVWDCPSSSKPGGGALHMSVFGGLCVRLAWVSGVCAVWIRFRGCGEDPTPKWARVWVGYLFTTVKYTLCLILGACAQRLLPCSEG